MDLCKHNYNSGILHAQAQRPAARVIYSCRIASTPFTCLPADSSSEVKFVGASFARGGYPVEISSGQICAHQDENCASR
jgi:hypothetical protein